MRIDRSLNELHPWRPSPAFTGSSRSIGRHTSMKAAITGDLHYPALRAREFCAHGHGPAVAQPATC